MDQYAKPPTQAPRPNRRGRGDSTARADILTGSDSSAFQRCYCSTRIGKKGRFFLDVQATQLRTGMLVKWKGELHTVHKTEHRTPGKGRGFVQAKLRVHRTGSIVEHKFASEERLERVSLVSQQMEYLYADGGQYTFMNTETYEQHTISGEQLGDQVNYLIANTPITVQFYEGNPFTIELPSNVDLEVVETEPAIKGATVTNVTKPARTETGLVVQVPGFIKEGEKIRVTTGDGTYQSRAN